MKPITTENIKDLDLSCLPRGANIILENGEPVAVIMRIDYYTYLSGVIKEAGQLVKEKLDEG